MRTSPNATTQQKTASNDWRVFLTTTWTTERVGLDLNVTGNPICQDNFRYNDVVSCYPEPLPVSQYGHKIRFSEHQPFYEMRNDGSGEPYANILEMRTDKIRNFLSVAKFDGISDVWTLQYEKLVANGTKELLERLSQATGIDHHCSPSPPQQRPPKKGRKISLDFASHVRTHLNWTVESWIGYYMDTSWYQ